MIDGDAVGSATNSPRAFAYINPGAMVPAGLFVLTFVRPEKIWFWGLQEAQLVAIAVLVVSVVYIFYLSKRKNMDFKCRSFDAKSEELVGRRANESCSSI